MHLHQNQWVLSLSDWTEIVRELRMRFRGEAVLAESTIREARNKIRAIDSRARLLRRVQPQQFTKEWLEREEKKIFMGLRTGPDGSAATGDLERPADRMGKGPDDLFGDVISPHKPSPSPLSGGASFEKDPSEPLDGSDEWTFDG